MSRIRFGALFVAGIALACCALGSASARTPTPAKYGGTLVVGLSTGEPPSLDPTAGGGLPIPIYRAMCQQLYDYDAKQQLVPVLAAAVPVPSTDKLGYTIQLRQGVKFNDGTPFNAQAVVTTVQHYMTPGSARAVDYTNVDSVTAAGQYTVVYHLKARDSTFIGGLSYILSPTQLAKLGDSFGTNPICVGPFMFDHRVPGDNVTLIKSPFYYDQPHVYLDKIVYKFMTDAPSATAALQAGDIQALYTVSTALLTAVQQDSALRVIQTPQLGWSGVIFNIGNKNGLGNLPYTNLGTPFASSAKLRQAFEEAIDRNALNRVVFGGLYQVTCTQIPPADTAWYGATKVPCTPYNPADAKKLIAASGFPNPTVHLLVVNTTDRLRFAQFIQAEEAAVGINVVIDTADTVTASARDRSGDFEMRFNSFTPGMADPSVNIAGSVATSGQRNFMGYSNPRLDLILDNAVKATSVKARSTLYHVAQQIVHDDRPIIPMYNAVTFAAYSTSLIGVRLSASGLIIVENARFK